MTPGPIDRSGLFTISYYEYRTSFEITASPEESQENVDLAVEESPPQERDEMAACQAASSHQPSTAPLGWMFFLLLGAGYLVRTKRA